MHELDVLSTRAFVRTADAQEPLSVRASHLRVLHFAAMAPLFWRDFKNTSWCMLSNILLSNIQYRVLILDLYTRMLHKNRLPRLFFFSVHVLRYMSHLLRICLLHDEQRAS